MARTEVHPDDELQMIDRIQKFYRDLLMSQRQYQLDWSDRVCYLCEPGHRQNFNGATALASHWQKKHRDHPYLRWQMAWLMDKIERLNWRPHIPEVDALSDGLCPTCHKGDGEGTILSSDPKIIVIYCHRDGDIIRRISL